MNLRLVISTLVFTLLGFTAVITMGFRHWMDVVDQLDRANERALVGNYIDRAGKASIAQQKVQLTWDDAFKAVVVGHNMAWADNYLGEFLWTNFHYDRQFLVAPQGEPIRAWADGKLSQLEPFGQIGEQVHASLRRMEDNRSVFGVPAVFRQLRDTKWPYDAKGRPLTRWTTALISYDGRPALLTIASILPDTDFGMLKRAPANLVSVRFLDAQFLTAMGEGVLLTDVDFSTRTATDPDVNSFALTGSSGARFGWLTWTSERQSDLIRSKVGPLFIAFVLILLTMIVSAGGIVRALLRAMRELTASEAQALYMALHDSMTGLPNRVQFLQSLKSRLDQRPAGNDTLVIVAYVDLDHFKIINDTLGHHVGDELICQVAMRLRGYLSEGDILARLGGDEFVVMRTAHCDSPAVQNFGKDLIALFAEPFNILGHMVTVTASCGLSWAPQQSEDPGELLRNADIALYQAKNRGRARFRGFTPDMDASIRWRHELENELRRAIADDELYMVYQPIVAPGTRQIEGMEALLRWDHPVRGEIGPGVFVPIAEQSGLMEGLGRWVMDRVFDESRQWPGQAISINLSPLQIMSRGFLGELLGLMETYAVDPSRYIFEVTEGILLDRTDHVLDVLSNLKAIGFRIALDDFGIGYSSLGYLRSFQFDRIKIDRSFIQNIENDLDAHAILKAITSLGRSLRMKIVAEGVETSLQNDLAVAAGCDLIQGYHYWRALTPVQVSELLGQSAAAAQPRKLCNY